MSDEPKEQSTNRESHPNASSPEGLAGDMGLSSEREGPFEDIEGTGSLSSAQHSTDGETRLADTSDDESEPTEELDKPDETLAISNVDRTVGEVQPDPVANKHEFDPSKNPRH
jgi:hypothetical protein